MLYRDDTLCIAGYPPRMKIATWNLERALPQSAQAERQRQWLNRIDADIWILTETHLGITPGADYYSVSSGPTDRCLTNGECWVQIWVRAGVLTPLKTADEARTAAALLTLPHGPHWVLYGTVLPWLGSTWRSHPPAQAFAAALAAQQSDWQQLRADYPTATLLVAGDFNQDLNALSYYGSRRNKEALRQALADSDLDCLTAGENDPVHRLIGGQHSNIDHICLAKGPPDQFQQSFAWPPHLDELRGLSDHFGVGIEVQI
ncbi:MAG TPA: endonuclease/exonuclease/phosphatase family protein [Nodosilinea sp.]|nr:endonuclease/exonuclease/phosphatase family protein [Nodosilinea sp.]